MDIVDATREHSLAGLPGLFGLPNDFNLEGHTTDEAQRAIDWVELNRPWVRIDQAASLSDLKYRCLKIDLFDLQTPYEISDYANYAWAQTVKGVYRLGLTEGNTIKVSSTILGSWEVNLRYRGKEETVTVKESLQAAVMDAEALVKKRFPHILRLVDRDSRWRKGPASEKQINLLRKRKIDIPDGITKGQASHLIGILPKV